MGGNLSDTTQTAEVGLKIPILPEMQDILSPGASSAAAVKGANKCINLTPCPAGDKGIRTGGERARRRLC